MTITLNIFPYYGTNTDTLMNKDDNAMYRAKAMGRNKYYFYENEKDPPN